MDGSDEIPDEIVGGVNAASQGYNGKPYSELCSGDVVGKWFATLDKAEDFYYDYADAIGFIARKDVLCFGKHKEVSNRKWCCSCAGKIIDRPNRKRLRAPKKETRTGCRAELRVNYCTSKKEYLAKKFITEHNHDLAPPSKSQCSSRQKCAEAEVAQHEQQEGHWAPLRQ